MKYALLLIIFSTCPLLTFSQNNLENEILGNHLLSLQWISWDYFGEAKINPSNESNVYTIDGIQKSKNGIDYLKINGNLSVINEKHLILDGTIETSVGYINDGQPCIRKGEFNFKAHGKRKYWRLQEKSNPCDNVTDYVDIYFMKKD